MLKLKMEHWTYQRYKWQKNLDPSVPPKEKVIKTLIYGVKPSGNQAQVGLRETARRQQEEYPQAANALIKDTYVDDCGTGAVSVEAADVLGADIDHVAGKGGFVTKGYTISGRPPLPNLSKDGESITVFGHKWFSEKDELQVGFGPLNFAKKHRGKKPSTEESWKVPEKLTKRICAGKVGELFELTGFIVPILAGFKLDMRDLILSGCGWDDRIPDEFHQTWTNNFQLMESTSELVYNRAVVPDNAVSMDIELIGAGDASERMVCAGCYIRFKLKDDRYSCQLILGKCKIVPEDMTLPRAEMFAATLNVHVMQIVKRALTNHCSDYLLFTDSEIALFWLTSQTKRQKPWVRNRAIEVNRFTNPIDWYHIDTSRNPADVGTRKGASIEDCDRYSRWHNGDECMQLPLAELRASYLKSVEEIKFEREHMNEINKELMGPVVDLCQSDFHLLMDDNIETAHSHCFVAGGSKCFVSSKDSEISAKVKERLKFSKYMIDPNKFKFHKVVRIQAHVIKAAKVWLSKIGKRLSRFSYPIEPTDGVIANRSALENIGCLLDETKTMQLEKESHTSDIVLLSDSEVQYSLDYFFQKATEEVKSYLHPKIYEKHVFERNNILYYSGRVLSENISFKTAMTDTMLDLSLGSFIVPVVERHSPLAYSIVNQIHWYHPTARHCGVETTIRFTMNVAHIFQVRELVKLFRKQCIRCRYLLKRTIDVEMAPASKHQLCVAPPYYATQLDLCGPFRAYSKHNKRTTLKIWIITYVCASTGMTNLKVMEGYDATQFLLAFSRFSCEVGFPKTVLIDPGSQLVSGCENMSLDMCTIKGTLNREFGIQFEACPVGGHNFHGKVERKIKTVQETIMKSTDNARLSVLQWETLCSEVANSINNLPIAIGNETEDLESLDLITPNRLRLGRNNDRSPVGTLDFSDKVDRILQQNSDIFNAWWELWLVAALPKLMPKPKWFKTDEHLKVGDIVLYNKGEGSFVGLYKYGIVEEVHRSDDGRIRSVTIRYRNANEDVNRTTVRAVRSLVVIHRIDELNIMEELGKAALLPRNSALNSAV
jgi:hypothetical protein